ATGPDQPVAERQADAAARRDRGPVAAQASHAILGELSAEVDVVHGLALLSRYRVSLRRNKRVHVEYLDVKRNLSQNAPVSDEQDHVDRWLAEVDLPAGVDLEVEGIVDRINGLRRRFHRMLDETLEEFGLNSGEWKALNQLRQAKPPHRRSIGQLASWAELSSGAMTNRVDRLEEAGFVRRVPDPNDRRGVLVELTDAGHKVWEESLRTGAQNEALLAAALTADEKQTLNALLRRLMREFERREQTRS